MFNGSIPQDALNIAMEAVSVWNKDKKCKRLYIGCSGNFTIERALQKVWDKEIVSNDVTVYSCLLGFYFSGQDMEDVQIKKEYDGEFAFVKDYFKDPVSKIACMLILSDALKFEKIKTPEKRNMYDDRMMAAYKRQWDRMFEKTISKIENMKTKITEFYAGDVCKMIDEVGSTDAMMCYPPFFAGDYEKMFEALSLVIDWPEPTYDMINKDKIHELFRKMTQKRHFMFGVDEHLDEFEPYLMGMSRTTNRGRIIYMYSDMETKRIITPSQKLSKASMKKITESDTITEKSEIKLVKLSSGEFHALRSQYMNAHIKPGQETLAVGVAVDNKLIGCYAFSADSKLAAVSESSGMGKHLELPMIYLLSDFPVSTTKYKRLAKLVLYAALSKESQIIAEKIMRRRVRTISTTAFSKNRVSMKYRGVFNLLATKKMSDDVKESADISAAYYNTGYKLCYGARIGEWTLREGFEEWLKKHSVVKKEGEANEG